MNKIVAALDGKKTYIVAGTVGVLAGVQMLGYQVPEWAWLLLNAAGLGAVRDALPVKK